MELLAAVLLGLFLLGLVVFSVFVAYQARAALGRRRHRLKVVSNHAIIVRRMHINQMEQELGMELSTWDGKPALVPRLPNYGNPNVPKFVNTIPEGEDPGMYNLP
jgi:hypothetical protein